MYNVYNIYTIYIVYIQYIYYILNTECTRFGKQKSEISCADNNITVDFINVAATHLSVIIPTVRF